MADAQMIPTKVHDKVTRRRHARALKIRDLQ